jgi:tetratricopeptide (TPR) repeat protein
MLGKLKGLFSSRTRDRSHPGDEGEIARWKARAEDLRARHLYEEAVTAVERVRIVVERSFAEEHPENVWALGTLAFLHAQLGDHKRADELYRRAYETAKSLYGERTAECGRILLGWAQVYIFIVDYGRAARCMESALDILRDSVGADHPDTVSAQQSLDNIRERLPKRKAVGHAFVERQVAAFSNTVKHLVERGSYKQALEPAMSALELAQHHIGDDHPVTLGSVNNLAFLYQTIGRYMEVESLYERVLKARERLLGRDHPDTLLSANNLAMLYQDLGQYGEAEPLLEGTLATKERVLGPEHPETLLSGNNLAFLYDNLGRYGEAESLYERVLKARERLLGRIHSDTLVSVHNLAWLYLIQARYSEAESLFERVLKAREQVSGGDHPTTLASVNNLAELYLSQGGYSKAEPLYERTLEASERVLGGDHPLTLTSLNNLAGCTSVRGDTAKPNPCLNE